MSWWVEVWLTGMGYWYGMVEKLCDLGWCRYSGRRYGGSMVGGMVEVAGVVMESGFSDGKGAFGGCEMVMESVGC